MYKIQAVTAVIDQLEVSCLASAHARDDRSDLSEKAPPKHRTLASYASQKPN